MHLALDSSVGNFCSAALVSQQQCLSYAQAESGKSNEQLLGLVDSVLKQSGVNANELSAVVYSRGPGAFMGIRVAASIAQALALAWQAQLLAVSTLEVLAYKAAQLLQPQQILTMLDARMQQVYCANYLCQADSWQCLNPECLLDPEQIPAATCTNAHMVGNAWHYLERMPKPALASWQYSQEDLLPDARALGLLVAADLPARLQSREAEQNPVYLRPAL